MDAGLCSEFSWNPKPTQQTQQPKQSTKNICIQLQAKWVYNKSFAKNPAENNNKNQTRWLFLHQIPLCILSGGWGSAAQESKEENSIEWVVLQRRVKQQDVLEQKLQMLVVDTSVSKIRPLLDYVVQSRLWSMMANGC